MHSRGSIRAGFVELLKDYTHAAERVYDSRVYNLAQGDLPAIIVFTEHEEVVTESISYPRTQNRRLKLSLQCYCKTTGNICMDVDILVLEVEKLIMASGNLQGKCKDCKLESTDITTHNEGEQPVAIATIIFDVLYNTKEDKPDILI